MENLVPLALDLALKSSLILGVVRLIAGHRMLIERAQACDDKALLHETDSADYATHLLDIAEGPQAGFFAAHADVAMARRSKRGGRLRAILDKQ